MCREGGGEHGHVTLFVLDLKINAQLERDQADWLEGENNLLKQLSVELVVR